MNNTGRHIVLVTGANGAVGVNTCLALAQNPDLQVIGMVRQLANSPAQHALSRAGIALQESDLAKPAALRALLQQFRPHVVVHLAAQVSVQQGNIADLMAVNVQGQANLLQAVAEVGGVRKFIYASTYSVYGTEGGQQLAETQPFGTAATPYAASKQMVEILTNSWAAATGIPAVGLRLFQVLGPWARAGSMIDFFAARLRAGQPVPLFSHGTLVRDFVAARDIARAIEKLIDQPLPGASCLNVGTGTGHTTLQLVHTLAAALGVEAKLELLGPRAQEPLAAVADLHKMQQTLQWQPTTTLAHMVEEYVHWHAAQGPDSAAQ